MRPDWQKYARAVERMRRRAALWAGAREQLTPEQFRAAAASIQRSVDAQLKREFE